jgi:hypothetical protein
MKKIINIASEPEDSGDNDEQSLTIREERSDSIKTVNMVNSQEGLTISITHEKIKKKKE